MKYHTHKLNSQNHSHIIARQDIIMRSTIKANDEVVFCSACKAVFLKESWESIDKKHCNQTETLDFIPTQEQMEAKKNASLFRIPVSNRGLQQSVIVFGLVLVMAIVIVPLLFSSAEQTWEKGIILFVPAILVFGLLFLVYQEREDLVKNNVFIKVIGETIVLYNESYKDEPIIKIEYKCENASINRVLRMAKIVRIYSDEKTYKEYLLDLEIQYPYNVNFLRNLMQVSEFAPITFYTEDKKEYQFLEETKNEYEGNIILTKKMPFY